MNNTVYKTKNIKGEKISLDLLLIYTMDGNVHVLNSTAAEIYNLIKENNTLKQIEYYMVEKYSLYNEVTQNEIKNDLEKVIVELISKNIIEEAE